MVAPSNEATMHIALLTVVLAAGSGQHWSFGVGATPSIHASQIAGPLSVQAAPGDKAEVEAQWLGGSESDHAKWVVDVKGEAGKLDVRVCCGPCGAHESHDCNDEGDLAITLHVPAASKLDASEVSGALEVSGVTGEISANTVSGSIALHGTQSALRLHAVSGAIRVDVDKAAPIKLNTVSGAATIKLPAGAGAKVKLSTVSGSINGRGGGIGTAEQTVGNGAAEIDATTVSGNIDVH
jgi:DUF4097 and DUF4098 domain-containing protein YvlB